MLLSVNIIDITEPCIFITNVLIGQLRKIVLTKLFKYKLRILVYFSFELTENIFLRQS